MQEIISRCEFKKDRKMQKRPRWNGRSLINGRVWKEAFIMEHYHNIMHIYRGKCDNEFYQLLSLDGLYGRFMRLNDRMIYTKHLIIDMEFWV